MIENNVLELASVTLTRKPYVNLILNTSLVVVAGKTLALTGVNKHPY